MKHTRLGLHLGLALALGFAAAPPALAQDTSLEQAPPRFHIGFGAIVAQPVGQFHDYVGTGGGLGVHLLYKATPAFGLRLDGGFVNYGNERRPVCFSSTVGCRVELELTTSNNIFFVHAGPQLMVPAGPVRPYANTGIGLSYFATESNVRGSGSGSGAFARTTNFSDVAFAWASGAGAAFPFRVKRTPVAIDLGATYLHNGRVEYLRKGGITDNPDGSITLNPTTSAANLVTYHIGVTIGIRAHGQR